MPGGCTCPVLGPGAGPWGSWAGDPNELALKDGEGRAGSLCGAAGGGTGHGGGWWRGWERCRSFLTTPLCQSLPKAQHCVLWSPMRSHHQEPGQLQTMGPDPSACHWCPEVPLRGCSPSAAGPTDVACTRKLLWATLTLRDTCWGDAGDAAPLRGRRGLWVLHRTQGSECIGGVPPCSLCCSQTQPMALTHPPGHPAVRCR